MCVTGAGDHKGRPYNTCKIISASPAYVAGNVLIPVVFPLTPAPLPPSARCARSGGEGIVLKTGQKG